MTGDQTGRQRAGYDGYHEVGTAAAMELPQPGGWLTISGGDAVSFLQGVLTNDVASLGPGEHCYAAYLTAQGRMLSDMEVLRRESDVLLAVEPEIAAGLAERFDRSLFTEDVRIQDLSGSLAALAVHGPTAHEATAGAFADGVAATIRHALDEGRHVTVQIDGTDVVVFGSTWLGVPGARIAAPPSHLKMICDRLTAAGLPVLGPGAALARRIEAGTPRFGVDMTTDTIPLEAGLEARAISTTKGCYVGQESSSASSTGHTDG